MNIQEEYRLSQYHDLGKLNEKEHIRLKRNRLYGTICVEKRVSVGLKSVYDFLKEHPTEHIPQIYECILTDDMLIVVEEYIEGRNLADIVQENPLSEHEAVWVVREVCEVLRMLHSAQPPIICRDIKAENVMIDRNYKLKLVDFNIARIFQEGKKRDTCLLGTAEYAAPEQFGFFQTDNRTDIYSLGVLLNYIVSGKFPVEERIDGKLGEIVKKSTFLDPQERYQSVDELQEHLSQLYPEYMPESQHIPASKNKRNRVWREYLPPGFRSRTPWNMCVAILGYIMITLLCFQMEIANEKVELPNHVVKIEQFIIWLSQIMFVGVACNYRGMKSHIPLLNSRYRLVRIIGYPLTEILLIILSAFLCAMVESVFL